MDANDCNDEPCDCCNCDCGPGSVTFTIVDDAGVEHGSRSVWPAMVRVEEWSRINTPDGPITLRHVDLLCGGETVDRTPPSLAEILGFDPAAE